MTQGNVAGLVIFCGFATAADPVNFRGSEEPRATAGSPGDHRSEGTLEALGGVPTAQPVPLWGFSDGTALLAAWTRWGWPAWHAPPLSQLPRLDGDSRERVRAAWHQGTVAPFEGLGTVRGGGAHGPLAGGNLCVLTSLVGTPFQAPLAGHIVVLEDIGEAPYKIDRMVRQLVLGGGLGEAAAIVLGHFTGVDTEASTIIDAFFEELAAELEIPVARGLPIGHGEENAPVPLGTASGHRARLECSGGEAILHVDGPAT